MRNCIHRSHFIVQMVTTEYNIEVEDFVREVASCLYIIINIAYSSLTTNLYSIVDCIFSPNYYKGMLAHNSTGQNKCFIIIIMTHIIYCISSWPLDAYS